MSRRGDGGPRKTAPPPPQVMRSGRDSWYRNRGRPDLVRHVLPDEDHLDRCGRTWLLAAQTRNGDEEVQAAHLSRGGVIDGCEATTAESSEDRFSGAADKHHRDGSVDRTTAAAEDVGPRLRGRLVPSGDASADLQLTPFPTPASLMAGSPDDLRIAHTGWVNTTAERPSAERLNSLGLTVV